MLFPEKVYSELSFIKNNVLIQNAKNFRKYFVYLTWTKLYVWSIRLECVPPVFYLFRRGIFEKYVSICDEYFCKYFFSDDYIKLTDTIHRENIVKIWQNTFSIELLFMEYCCFVENIKYILWKVMLCYRNNIGNSEGEVFLRNWKNRIILFVAIEYWKDSASIIEMFPQNRSGE